MPYAEGRDSQDDELDRFAPAPIEQHPSAERNMEHMRTRTAKKKTDKFAWSDLHNLMHISPTD